MKDFFKTENFLSFLLPMLFGFGPGIITWFFPQRGMMVLCGSFLLVGFVAGLRLYPRHKLEKHPRKRLYQMAPVLIPLAVGFIPATDWAMSAFPAYSRWIAISVYGILLPVMALSYLALSLKSTLAVLNRNPTFPEVKR
jgi:hypothetical protein